ncbi:MAG: hypothetical protein ABIO60_12990 [Aquaticitalea sp.]
MKKIFLIAIAFIGFSTISMAQDISDNAIGLRLGDSNGFGAEVSYQRALGSDNRLELDLGIRNGNNYDGFKLAGIYQWVWNIDGGFNWYAGPGAGLATYNSNFRDKDGNKNSETYLFVGGDVGIEYNFDIPLMISLDVRPEFGLGNSNFDNNNLDLDIAFGIRYQF